MTAERDKAATPGWDRASPRAYAPHVSLDSTTPLPEVAGAVPLPPTLPLHERLVGRFEIVRFIARGGMGAVYEAEDTMLRTRVAVKTILPELAADPTAMERFRREVLLARRVTHVNICRIFELYETLDSRGERLHFLTMELLEGESLSDRLARTGPMATSELLILLRHIADGLEAMHSQDVIHRDFKPANVFLVHRASDAGQAPFRAVITDFGIARALHRNARSDGHASATNRVGFVGTPAYIAPEQLTGLPASAATDVYALGIVLYEALTGTVPFSGQTPLDAAMKRLHQEPAPPSSHLPGLDPRWDTAILRCLAREPERRFRSVQDVLRAVTSGAQDPRRSVAVLGFRNLASRSDGAWLSTALGELIGQRLAGDSRTLRTLPTEEVARSQRALALVPQDTLAPDVLRRLREVSGAEFAVLGSYLCMGSAPSSPLRLAVRVQDTGTGAVVCTWAEKGTVADLHALATRAGEQLLAALATPA